MATLQQQYRYRNEQDALRNRVAASLLNRAHIVRAEPVDTTNHANRAAWALHVIESDSNAIAVPALGWLMAESTIQSSGNDATDAQIDAAVLAQLNNMTPAAIPARPDLTDEPEAVVAYILALEAVLHL